MPSSPLGVYKPLVSGIVRESLHSEYIGAIPCGLQTLVSLHTVRGGTLALAKAIVHEVAGIERWLL